MKGCENTLKGTNNMKGCVQKGCLGYVECGRETREMRLNELYRAKI